MSSGEDCSRVETEAAEEEEDDDEENDDDDDDDDDAEEEDEPNIPLSLPPSLVLFSGIWKIGRINF